MREEGALGKKIFFLHPAPVLEEVAEALASREFEVYLTREHEGLKRILQGSPDAIVFINLDEGLKEEEWEAYVVAMKADAPKVGIGVLTLNDVPALREKYIMELQVPCGFVIMKIGAAKAAEILVKTLEANEARGRRKFVRASCPPGTGKVNLERDNMTLEGELTDISSAGMAIAFPPSVDLRVGTVLRSLSVSVKAFRMILSGVVVAGRDSHATREGGDANAKNAVHVVMFDPASLDESRKEKLKSLVFRLNQASLERELRNS